MKISYLNSHSIRTSHLSFIRKRFIPQGSQFIKHHYNTSVRSNSSEKAESSKPVANVKNELQRPSHFKNDLLQFLHNKEMYLGKPLHGFPKLQELLKGLRGGEMTVFTGPTGSGKTTFLCQYTLKMAQNGIKTLWGSFEISNLVLIRKMICQLKKTNFEDFDSISLSEALLELEKYPIYFMPYFGSTKIESILTLIQNAKNQLGVEHVVLDNLQFFLSGQSNSSIEKFQLQDNVVHLLRQFATRENIHITIVVHPRKESLYKLTLESISGTAKVTQEADNVLLLQKKPYPSIDVVKNRFDGSLGRVSLSFHKSSNSYSEEEETRADFPSNFS